MQEKEEKLEWSKPEIFILDFRKTSTGAISAPNEDGTQYTGTQAS